MPPMTQAQLQMAAQQQLAPLQQQQQAQQAQQAAAAAAHVQAAQLAAQQQQFQNLVQGGQHQRIDPSQFQQLHLRQLAQANMSRAQGAVANMAQANAMARVQAAMHAQQQQQQQMGDVMQGQGLGQGQGQMNFGSPRPPQMQQGQVGQGMQQTKNMRQTIAKLSAMPEAQREQIFNTVSISACLDLAVDALMHFADPRNPKSVKSTMQTLEPWAWYLDKGLLSARQTVCRPVHPHPPISCPTMYQSTYTYLPVNSATVTRINRNPVNHLKCDHRTNRSYPKAHRMGMGIRVPNSLLYSE